MTHLNASPHNFSIIFKIFCHKASSGGVSSYVKAILAINSQTLRRIRMRKNLIKSAMGFTSLAFIIIVIGSYVIAAQTAVTGEWTAKTEDQKEGKIYISFERRMERGGRNQNGQNYDYSDLQGLNRQQAQNGKVSFRLVREAGTIDCEGTFQNGRGAGTFTFTPNTGFVEAMRARGFDFADTKSKHRPGKRYQ